MKTVMKNEYQCLDLVVRKFSNAPSPHVHLAPNVPPADPPLNNLEVDQKDAVAVPDAQSAPNEFGICPDDRVHCRIDDVDTAPQEITLTQNHPSKCRSNTTFSYVIRPDTIFNCCLNAEYIPDNIGVPPCLRLRIQDGLLIVWMFR
jgi:hypothetical protein